MSRQRVLLIVAFFGICIYTSVFLLGPLMDRVARHEQMIASLTQKAVLAGKPAEEKERLNREVKDLQRKHELLDRKVPHGVENAEMIVILNSLAAKHNLRQMYISESRPGQVSPGQQNDGTRLPGNTFLWKGFGPYQDIKGFLRALEECDRLLEISDLKLKRTGDESVAAPQDANDEEQESLVEAEPQLSVSFQVKTYYDPSSPGSEGTAPFLNIAEETQGTANPFE